MSAPPLMKTFRRICVGLAALLGFLAEGRAADDADAFPHRIALELGAVEFAPGDAIVIESIHGNRPHLEVGGRYVIAGTYTLASANSARLGWSITSRRPVGPVAVAAEEATNVTKGSGRFRLIKTFRTEGWSHVSFYANGHSWGGVYLGEAGVEETILRRKSWSDFPAQTAASSSPPSPPSASSSRVDLTAAAKTPGVSGANAAILAYLGNPVAAPSNLDARYGPDALVGAFRAYCASAGLTVQTIAIDESEFPFLVYGVVTGRQGLPDLKTALSKGTDYSYGGSVVGSNASRGTFFAVNLIPSSRYPAGMGEAINRRLMIRLQMLANRVQQ
jgi:hypothetical protein